MVEFNFSYYTQKVNVKIDDTIKFKIGVFKIEIEKQNLKALYISSNEKFNELIIRYDNGKGRIKNKKIMFLPGETQAIELADYLVENTNCEDLRSLEKKEALKKLKATDTNKVGFIAAVVIMFTIATVFFLPQIMHYFDTGHQDVTISQLIDGKDLTTSNVTVTNGMLIDGIWFQTTSTRRGHTSTSSHDYFPLVPLNWTENDPIKVIVKTEELSQDEIDDLFSQESFTGVLKNKLWEGGLGSDETNFFKNQYPNYKLDNDILILDMEEPVYVIMLIVYGIVMVILIGVAFALKKKLK